MILLHDTDSCARSIRNVKGRVSKQRQRFFQFVAVRLIQVRNRAAGIDESAAAFFLRERLVPDVYWPRRMGFL